LSKEIFPVYQPHYKEEETEINGSQQRAEISGSRTTNVKEGYRGQLSKIEGKKKDQHKKQENKFV
jgi:hypothetical protein